MKSILVSSLLILISNSAIALEWITGKVTIVEPSYMPGAITFQMGADNTTCPAGTWLTWSKTDAENNKAVYSTLMTALVGGKNINFVINDGDTSCQGQHLHLLSN